MADLMTKTTLDAQYVRINSIYLDRNFYRTHFSIFAHLCEIVGGLSLLASGKSKAGVDPARYMPKALAWWMALCGKMGVRSVEDMIWSKFPYACPYCQRCPHEPKRCKEAKRGGAVLDWAALDELAKTNVGRRPRTIAEWQKMFTDLYPCGDTDSYESTFARFTEEIGEMAEALRAFPVAPGYFLSEAADMFAWLMHLHALYQTKRNPHRTVDEGAILQDLFEREYTVSCSDCRNRVCTCPPILPRTLGRIAHDVPAGLVPFAPGGALLPTEDALALFQLGARSIKVGTETYPVTGDLLRDMHSAIGELLRMTRDNRTITIQVQEKLTPALMAIAELTSSQRITQESIDSLAHRIAALPSEARTTVMGFLTNIAAGPWVAALLKGIESLAGV